MAILLTAVMWGFIGWSLRSEYNGCMAAGRTQGHNLTAAFAGQLSLTFDRVDGALRLIEAQIRPPPHGVATPTSAPQDADWIANRFPGTTGLFGGFRVIDQDGRLRYSTLRPDPGPSDYAAQFHFITHRKDPTAGLLLGQRVWPLVGETAASMLEVTRRIDNSDGRFGGEVILMVRPADLIDLQNDIDLGRHGGVAVLGVDGVMRAGFDIDHPDGSAALGLDLTGPSFPAELLPGAVSVYTWHSQRDGMDRLFALRRLPVYPLVVMVALDLHDVLGQAKQHAWLFGMVGSGTTLLLIVMTSLLLREVWRRTNREIERAADQGRLRAAHSRIEADRRKLGEANWALRVSKENAEAASQAKSQFLAHMSHELRTPLHAIIGFSDLIQEQAPPAQPGAPPIASYAADISSSGRHLLELINAILDISKVESGTVTLNETIFSVVELARDSLTALRGQAETRSVKLELRAPDDPVRIRADRTRLQQILLNLLSNGVKFTPQHGLVTLSVHEREIAGRDAAGGTTVGSSTAGLVLSVTDTGIGMTDAEIRVALEPFRQVDNTLSRSFDGTGLGLPLAARLTELHGGQLELRSVKGLGTTVSVVLPATRLMPHDVMQAHA